MTPIDDHGYRLLCRECDQAWQMVDDLTDKLEGHPLHILSVLSSGNPAPGDRLRELASHVERLISPLRCRLPVYQSFILGGVKHTVRWLRTRDGERIHAIREQEPRPVAIAIDRYLLGRLAIAKDPLAMIDKHYGREVSPWLSVACLLGRHLLEDAL